MSANDDNFFDAIIIGTGLPESILAAALSKAKYKVAHIDPNPYYGGDEASLSQDELLKWGEQVSEGKYAMYESYSGTTDALPFSRQYSICLKPSVIPALGPLIAGLIASGVAKYSGFKLLDSVSIYTPDGIVKNVPGSKEAIFNTKDISLIEKRRLMRFLTFAGGEFEEKNELQGKEDIPFQEFLKTGFQLSDPTIAIIAYALAHCVSTTDRTLPSLLRLRGYLHSIGRYGPSPFLVGHYGGLGDISQGFCRAAAVNGGVYVLGRPVSSTSFHSETMKGDERQEAYIEVQLDDFPEVLKSHILVSSTQNKLAQAPATAHPISVPPPASSPPITGGIARCVAIFDTPLQFQSPEPSSTASEDSETETTASGPAVDTAMLIIPPATLPSGSQDTSATVFVNGENSLSTPKGRWIVYITLPLTSTSTEETAEAVLKPYLDAVLKLTQNPEASPAVPIYSSFFYEKSQDAQPEIAPQDVQATPRYFITPPISYSTFPDLPDNATRIAEVAFRKAIRSLRELKGDPVRDDEEIDFWPPIPLENDSEDED